MDGDKNTKKTSMSSEHDNTLLKSPKISDSAMKPTSQSSLKIPKLSDSAVKKLPESATKSRKMIESPVEAPSQSTLNTPKISQSAQKERPKSKEMDTEKRSNPIVTRSMSSKIPKISESAMKKRPESAIKIPKISVSAEKTRSQSKLKTPTIGESAEKKHPEPAMKSRRKNTKSKEAMGKKLNKIQLVGGGDCYTSMTEEEYYACQKGINEMLRNLVRDKGPDYDKQQSDWLCTEYFPMIQKSRLEMADYVLVEPMNVKSILVGGCWAHMNFKAKPKDEDDSATSIWFAELDVPEKKVTKLVKLDIDLSGDTSAYKHCGFCHQDPEDDRVLSVGGAGCVYHPVA